MKKNLKVLLGVGNCLLGDDGVGSWVARNFKGKDWVAFDGGTAPENFTGKIRAISPAQVVVVDAARLGLPPGSLRRVPVAKLAPGLFTTHALPWSFLAQYLHQFCSSLTFLGIEPLTLAAGEELSPPVKKAALWLLDLLARGEQEKIPLL